MPVPDVREWHVCWHARLAAMGARLPDEWASRPPQVLGRNMFQYMARTTSGLPMQVLRHMEALYGPLEAYAMRRLVAIGAGPGGNGWKGDVSARFQRACGGGRMAPIMSSERLS